MKQKSLSIIFLLAIVMLFAACGKDSKPVENPNMNYRTLGSTNIRVAEIGIGCGVFEYLDSTESRRYVDIALDSGINYIDIYDANPLVRKHIGYALEGRRDRMVIQGHIGNYWNGNQYERTRDLEKCKKSFNDLLTYLNTDHIEVGMIHIADDMDEWNEIIDSEFLEYVKQLKAEGKIEHIGMSSHNAEVALAAAKSGIVEVIMFSLNPAFDRIAPNANPWDKASFDNMLPGIDPVRIELYDYCAQHNIAITVMKVFGGGGRLLSADSSPLGYALTPTECIAYALAKPCVAVALVGSREIKHLVEDLHYMVASDEEKDFNATIKAHEAEAVKQASGCTYCGHCTPCKHNINIAKINMLLDKAEQAGEVTKELQAQYDALEHHASECTQCGACMQRCPFSVDIIERMTKAQELFGH